MEQNNPRRMLIGGSMSLLVYGRLGQPFHPLQPKHTPGSSSCLFSPSKGLPTSPAPLSRNGCPSLLLPLPLPFSAVSGGNSGGQLKSPFQCIPKTKLKPAEFRSPFQRERAYPEEIKIVSVQRRTFNLRKAQTSCFTIS